MKPLLLMVLDGWGYRAESQGNAIALANVPNWKNYFNNWPHTFINASGLSVGLPDGTMGNSEVGHLNLGAGRVVYQEFTKINKSIEDGSFFQNEVLKKTFETLKKSGSALHLMGLVSDVGVHSHLNHLYALIDLAVKCSVQRIFIHCFTDGRDSSPDSGINYVKQIEEKISDFKFQITDPKSVIKVATVTGRYFAMDRDKRWDRVEKAYGAIVDGVGKKVSNASLAVLDSYKNGKTDEFVEPSVIYEGEKPVTTVNDGDAVVFFNFRADRARQLTHAMTDENFSEFKRRRPDLSAFVMMTPYEEKLHLPAVFSPERLENIFGEVISKNHLHQLRIAETEKYAHVTYFFNGGEEKVFPNEDLALIPSPRDVPTYDKKPQMSAFEVAAEVVKRIESEKYDVIILNFANPDMVGHSGNLLATISAVEAVDQCIGQVVSAVLSIGGVALITADHGNCETMFDERGEPQTAHTTDLVPFVVVGKGFEKKRLRDGGALCDVAPTMLEILKIEQPKEMNGTSLFFEPLGRLGAG